MTLLSVLLLVGILVGLATLFGAFARNTWLGTLAVQFSPHYGLVMLGVAVGFFLLGYYGYMVSALLIASLNLADMLFRIRWKGKAFRKAERGEASLRIFLANVNVSNREAGRIADAIGRAAPDLVLLIEVSPELDRLLEERTAKGWKRGMYHVYRDGKVGLKVLSNVPLSDVELHDDEDGCNLPALAGTVEWGAQRIRLLVAHPLPPERPGWVQERRSYLMNAGRKAREWEGETILLGDLNTTPWDPLFGDLLRESGLRDGRKGFGYVGTWPTLFPPMLIPIDHVLVSDGIETVTFRRGRRVGSDHWSLDVILNPESRS